MTSHNASMILIDAYSQIFRAFYAIRMLTNSRGEPVNAAYIFTKLLLKLEKNYPVSRGGMFFDCGKVAFRLALAPDYKANRPPMPEALKQQMPLLRRIASAFGWPLLQHEGWEADDLIGGAVQKMSGETILILSSDKDLSQLVDERVSLLCPKTGPGGLLEVRGPGEVEKKFGVPPGAIADYLALLGDASDNITGVAGIGPKSAVEVLTTIGPIASWIDAPEKIAASRFAAKLAGKSDLLRRNLALVSLRTQWPEAMAPAETLLRKAPPQWQEIRAICSDNGFASILKELPPPETPDAPEDLFSLTPPKAPEKETPPEQPELFSFSD